ncbi:MAG: hypothetical protein D6728_01250 [Cyanobacteria bacterium J055]|nr:MAG: hypothetical protein D6728_01250 [Cyanobacteria bacterium J055]
MLLSENPPPKVDVIILYIRSEMSSPKDRLQHLGKLPNLGKLPKKPGTSLFLKWEEFLRGVQSSAFF